MPVGAVLGERRALHRGDDPLHPLDNLALTVGALGGDVADRSTRPADLVMSPALLLDLAEDLDRAIPLVPQEGERVAAGHDRGRHGPHITQVSDARIVDLPPSPF